MADKRIKDLLPYADNVYGNDLFVLEQAGAARAVEAQTFIGYLATELAGHGGIANITYEPNEPPSLDGTLTIEMADGEEYTVAITNGNGIASIGIHYGISNNGTDPGYVPTWYAVIVEPTDLSPYLWTRISITDTTGNVTYAYGVSRRADNPSIGVGDVTAASGASANVAITNSGTPQEAVLDFDFTLPKGDKGDTGDYIEPVASYGTSTAAATEPSTWWGDPTMISYVAGNFIWRRTQYVLHEAQTAQDTKTEIIGYIGQNGAGSGTVSQITFNGDVYTDDGTGNVGITVAPEDVGAIADPPTKSNGQVLTYDSSSNSWAAANPSTGNVNTVNNTGVDVGTTNITLYGTNIKMSSSDSTTVQAAIPARATATPSALGTAAVGSSTKYATENHVHPMPSASDVGAVPTGDVDYKIYSSVSDIGLTVGSATISGAWSALGDNEILICDGSDFAAGDRASTYGTAEIIKYSSSRGYINWRGKEVGNGEYRMFLNSSNAPDGTWRREALDGGTISSSQFTVTGVSGGTFTLGTCYRFGNAVFMGYSIVTSGAPTNNGGLYCHVVDATVKLNGDLPKFAVGNGSVNNSWSLTTATSSGVFRTRVFSLQSTQAITIGTYAVVYF